MQHSRALWQVAGVITFALLFVTTPVTALAAPTVEVAASDSPGVFTFSAQGFTANEEISTWITGPSQQVQATDSQTADSAGAVTFQLLLPRHLQGGSWAITLHGLESSSEAIVSFDVPVRGPDITLMISQTTATAGTTLEFASTEFQPNETVSYWLTGPDGTTYTGGTARTTDEGRVDFTYTFGTGALPGQWTMSAYGHTSDHLGEATFTAS